MNRQQYKEVDQLLSQRRSIEELRSIFEQAPRIRLLGLETFLITAQQRDQLCGIPFKRESGKDFVSLLKSIISNLRPYESYESLFRIDAIEVTPLIEDAHQLNSGKIASCNSNDVRQVEILGEKLSEFSELMGGRMRVMRFCLEQFSSEDLSGKDDEYCLDLAITVLSARLGRNVTELEEVAIADLFLLVEREYRKQFRSEPTSIDVVKVGENIHPQRIETPADCSTDFNEEDEKSRFDEKIAALSPSVRNAYLRFLAAEEWRGQNLTDQEAYEIVKEELDPVEGKLPTFETWSRHLRTARRALRDNKYHRRSGRRHGTSIVKQTDVESSKSE